MEQVLVVPRRALFGDHVPHGLVAVTESPDDGHGWLTAIRDQARFALRSDVEDDPSLKQIIPYCVLVRGDDMLLLQRLAGGGERRLHHLLSVGVGGHINPGDDAPGADLLLAGARRELLEEVTLSEGTMGIIGFVNDDSNTVGSVHFGVVFKVDVAGDPPLSRERDQLVARLEPIREVMAQFSKRPEAFETWSRMVLSAWHRVGRDAPRTTFPIA